MAAAVVPAALLLAGVETALRLGGYGYPTAFFSEHTEGSRESLRDNPYFAWRFVPPALARSPLPFEIAIDKPTNGCRVLVFGESAAMGDPEPAFGFSRVLQVLLQARCPEIEVEVVNTAFPAVNSHVIREIARDAHRARADVWIVYMGNNEVLGPYGLTPVFGPSAPRSLTIWVGMQLRRLRTGQLVGHLVAHLRPQPLANSRAVQDNLTKHPIEADDPLLPRIYGHFEQNLRAIIRAGERAGAQVLVNTIVSNLRDCAPFVAAREPSLSEAQLRRWEQLLREGRQLLAGGTSDLALTRLQEAVGIEGRHAELQYQLGRARLALGQTNEARQHLESARDLDGFRARADSCINEIIRRVVSSHQPSERADSSSGPDDAAWVSVRPGGRGKVRLIDAENAFAAASPGGVPGDEFLCDHVHFRFAGNYLLALLQAEEIAALLPPPTNRTAGWLTIAECESRLALTEWNRCRMTTALRRQFSGKLYRGQSNSAERDARLRRELLSLESANRPEAFESTARRIQEAIARSPYDWVLYDQLGKLRLAFGDRPGAADAWRHMVQLAPHGFLGHYQLGLVLNQADSAAEALTHLQEARRIRPFVPEVYAALGTAHTHLGQHSAADAAFRRALDLDPANESARIAWALSFLARSNAAAARAQLEQAVATNSNSVPAHLHLARLLAMQGQTAAASTQFCEVLRIDPRNQVARRFLSESASMPLPDAPSPTEALP